MIEKLNVPKFRSETEEAEWWDQHREETAQWMEEAAAAGQTTTLSAVLKRARERSGHTPTVTLRLDPSDAARARTLAARRGIPWELISRHYCTKLWIATKTPISSWTLPTRPGGLGRRFEGRSSVTLDAHFAKLRRKTQTNLIGVSPSPWPSSGRMTVKASRMSTKWRASWPRTPVDLRELGFAPGSRSIGSRVAQSFASQKLCGSWALGLRSGEVLSERTT
jgi:hypothetical protein